MCMRTLIFLTSILLIFLNSPLGAQDKKYDQFIRGNNVGHLYVTTNSSDDGKAKKITVESVVNVNLIFTRARIEYTGWAEYKNGVLQKAEIEILRDGDIHTKSITKKTNGSYSVVIEGEQKKLDRYSIKFSSLMLYSVEPFGVGKVYAEVDGVYNRLRDQGMGKYELHLGGSRKNLYHYENGVLVQAKLDHWIAPITVRIRE